MILHAISLQWHTNLCTKFYTINARGGGTQTRSNSNNGVAKCSNQFAALDESNKFPTIDPRSPYFLSNGDNASASLVPKILTGADNYSSWCRLMMVALMARNKIKFINGKLPKPDEDDEDYESWIKCNSLVISWILNSVSPTTVDSIMYMEDASQI
ncbi:uncharacterized protein LOC133030608 [Cannabis sativa]|uniref:uncharacterized protein LOC133030608 n=1 Tax=Cannabis sativa TaxID=3483 RepID=UPI0029CA17A4|nr:uncharacterized protein LOC133030608 [Cannabis sativa]